MRIIPSSTSSEHWLTLMNCTICAHTPDNSPIYKCGQGHTICYPCFKKLSTGIPLCGICESDKFTRQDVSDDFLKKLKYKPGIGRPRRYVTEEAYKQQMLPFNNNDETAVTVEKLFQMSSSKIHQLFNDNTKDKIRQLNSFSYSRIANSYLDLKNEKRDEEVCTVHTLEDNSSKMWLRKSIKDPKPVMLDDCGGSILSRKPLKCPHDPCNKIIAVSSFQDHFKYEHNEFQRYQLERGNELVIVFDPALIQYDKTFCLAIIQLYQHIPETTITQTSKNTVRKKELDTFWVMVSGSPDDRPSHAFAVYWLFTNTNNEYKTTLELSSQHDIMAATTFCGVNGIHESQNISDIAQRLNCIFLTYGSLKTMLTYGPMIKFRITIH